MPFITAQFFEKVKKKKVGRRRRLTDSEKALFIKPINEPRRAKQKLIAAELFHCKHTKGRPILWKPGKGGGGTMALPPPPSPMASPPQPSAGKRPKAQPADGSAGKPKSARKSRAASPNADRAAAILNRLAPKAGFAIVPRGARSPGYSLYETSQNAGALAGVRPTQGDGMSIRGRFLPSAATAATAVTAPARMEAAEVKHSKRSGLSRWCFIVSTASVLLGVLSFFRAVSFPAV